MDIGTILLYIIVIVGIVDFTALLLGPRLKNHENISYYSAIVSAMLALVVVSWMAFLIFANAFQYDYIFQVTSIDSDFMLKISGIWAGQSGSLVFWTMLSYLFYVTFRVLTRGYDDDVVVYRASIIMAIESAIVAINAILSDPFRITEAAVRTDGMGLNPLLRTFWNAIHPPLVFIGYALVMVPFAVKLAGLTLRSEDRNSESIPVVQSYTKFMTILAWLFLSLGIAIGGYWAYIVLGWGGYWNWDPVETTSLIPWLMLTAYFHAKAVLKDNEVLRDSFLIFAYVTVIMATWVTRSGVLSSIHGFSITIVSWSMLIALLFNFIMALIITVRAGYIELEDEEDSWSFFSLKNVRTASIRMALIGLIIIISSSVIGIVVPATINLYTVFTDISALQENMISMNVEFFRGGFYLSSVFLVASAFFCMKNSLFSDKRKSILVIILFAVGGLFAGLTYLNDTLILPTNYWPANFLIPIAAGAVVYLVVTLVRVLAGKEGIYPMRRMGRVMLHLGLVILLLGVFMSENVVFETNSGYTQGAVGELAPNLYLRVTDIEFTYYNNPYDFHLQVMVQVIEGDMLVGYGYVSMTGYPQWNFISHDVYVHSTYLRDVFIAITGWNQISPTAFMVTVHAKVLPLISFVWAGTFLMVMSLIPMAGIEFSNLRKAISGKKADLYEELTSNGDTQ